MEIIYTVNAEYCDISSQKFRRDIKTKMEEYKHNIDVDISKENLCLKTIEYCK